MKVEKVYENDKVTLLKMNSIFNDIRDGGEDYECLEGERIKAV